MADLIGQQFDDYRLVRLIGQGDLGEVFLAEHFRHSGQAAIKVFHTRLRDLDALRFYNEVCHIYNLRHPNVVRLLDYDVKVDIPFLIMDYLPNGTLRQRHPEGTRLPLDQILFYVKQVADVLQYAHNHNLIHCDVKPENMLLARNDVVLLSDFCPPSIGRSLFSQSKQAVPIHTLNYLAPEQIQGHPVPASDQYALGVIVYEWVSGARPFNGSSPEIMKEKHLTVPPPSLYAKNPAFPNAVEQVVLKALAKNP
jgi:eukaryotic-like serine/threonine-protein kinase